MREFGFIALLFAVLFGSCGEDKDPLAPSVSVSGTVTNNSGHSGTIIVEITHNARDIADTSGAYSIAVHKDYYVDSLYAWVDLDGSGTYTAGEPFGFYHSIAYPTDAKSFHVRSSNIIGIDFSIP
jgi:hypothetical protein